MSIYFLHLFYIYFHQFFYLEQLIIKHRAQRDCVNITARPDGVDFYFGSRTHAKRLVEFLSARTPLRVKTSERLISADIQNATANFKHSFSTEIAPICRDDVVCLHPGLAKKLGGIRYPPPLLPCPVPLTHNTFRAVT